MVLVTLFICAKVRLTKDFRDKGEKNRAHLQMSSFQTSSSRMSVMLYKSLLFEILTAYLKIQEASKLFFFCLKPA